VRTKPYRVASAARSHYDHDYALYGSRLSVMSYGWIVPAFKPKIFVSYHHGGDREYYDALCRVFCNAYDIVRDSSVDRIIDSDNAEYVIRRIREEYITGTSCTVVLCGAETPRRKFVDWEIKATLDKQHGLLGVNLPTNRSYPDGTWPVPDRFLDNYRSGYASFVQWSDVVNNAGLFAQALHEARGKETWKVDNSRELRSRNG